MRTTRLFDSLNDDLFHQRSNKPLAEATLDIAHYLNPLGGLQELAQRFGFSGALLGVAGVYLFLDEYEVKHVLMLGTGLILLGNVLRSP